MGVEENKETVRRVFEEVVNQGNLELVRELYTDDMVDHDPMPGTPPGRGPEPVIQTLRELRTAYPDLQVEIVELVGEGDFIAERAIWRGTNLGKSTAGPATGKRAEWNGMVFWRFEDGKIAERWGIFDVVSMLRQLGAIPPMDAGPGGIAKFIVTMMGRSVGNAVRRGDKTPAS